MVIILGLTEINHITGLIKGEIQSGRKRQEKIDRPPKKRSVNFSFKQWHDRHRKLIPMSAANKPAGTTDTRQNAVLSLAAS